MSRRRVRWLRAVGVGLALGLAANAYIRHRLFAPGLPDDAIRGASAHAPGASIRTVADRLEVPWEVRFLPDGGFLVTERPGRLVRLDADGRRTWTTPVPDVRHRGEGGLLGLALDPDFPTNGWIYLYLTTASDNRIERWTVSPQGDLGSRRVLLDGIPAAGFHNGGRLEFGPDGMLWATTGDAGTPAAARDPASLAGKILRMTPEGGVPGDNPFGTVVWSVGHRNPQGLAWDLRGRLWSTEHGRSGVRSGLDEVNQVVAGGDYGWPDYQGDAAGEDVHAPALHSGPSSTWAPSGAAWLGARFFFGGLRGQALYEVQGLSAGRQPRLLVHFFGELGRIRQVRAGPDGMLYLLTNNRDGRGRPGPDDDRLLRLDPATLAPVGS